MKRSFFGLVLFLSAATTALSQTRNEEFKVRPSTKGVMAKTEGSEFSIDANLVNKMFEASTKSDEVTVKRSSVGQSILAVGQMMPAEFTTENRYFSIPYEKSLPTMPVASLSVMAPLAQGEKYALRALFSTGYSYSQAICEPQTKTGIQAHDTIDLQWVPFHAGGLLDLPRIRWAALRPGLQASGGVEWISQKGTLDGIDQSFWVPAVMGGPILTFFAPESSAGGPGFDGLILSGLYLKSTGQGPQKIRGWNWNLGGRFAF